MSRARTYRTEAIVLIKHKFGEADNILRLLSPEHGRVGAIAKGVRKTKSKFGGRLEPFSHVDLMLHQGRNLHTVVQAESVESFDEIRTNYDKLTHGAAVLELLDKLATEGHGDERLFGLGLAALRALGAADGSYERILSAFEIKLMAIGGYRPHLDGCVICGVAAERVFFSSRAGGIMCEACSATDPASRPLGHRTVVYLRDLLGTRMGELGGISPDESAEAESAVVLREFIACHIQSRLKGRELLENR